MPVYDCKKTARWMASEWQKRPNAALRLDAETMPSSKIHDTRGAGRPNTEATSQPFQGTTCICGWDLILGAAIALIATRSLVWDLYVRSWDLILFMICNR